MVEEERKDADEECSCGHFLDSRKSHSVASSGTAKATIMDSSFVHLPVHLYQHVIDEGTRKPSFVTSSYGGASNFLQTYQHLQEMIRASHSGGDGAKLCVDCITRYV